MRDLFLAIIWLSYLFFGLRAPFVIGLGYIWVDYMNPQHIAYSFMTSVPVSLIMAAAAIFGYIFLAPKDETPRFGFALWLFVLWALWVTLTSLWAVDQTDAWIKWNWAFKTICFAGFLPFLFTKRVHIEAMLLTIIFSIGAAALAGAVKTVVTGGGYKVDLGLFRGNSGLSEGSTVACLAIASIPLLLYMYRDGIIFKKGRFSFWLFHGLSVACVILAVGTFERTGLISMAVLAVGLFPIVKRKVLYAASLIAVVVISGWFLSDKWMSRMDTITNYSSDTLSAVARLKVWAWTWGYVKEHPLGGGFDVYRINHIYLPAPDSNDLQAEPAPMIEQTARAFHSMWFEVLGEQGFPGFAIFVSMIATFFISAARNMRRTRDNDQLRWINSLSRFMMISVSIYCVGGCFIGVAFQPFLYDMLAAGIALNECTRRALGAPVKGAMSAIGKPQHGILHGA